MRRRIFPSHFLLFIRANTRIPYVQNVQRKGGADYFFPFLKQRYYRNKINEKVSAINCSFVEKVDPSSKNPCSVHRTEKYIFFGPVVELYSPFYRKIEREMRISLLVRFLTWHSFSKFSLYNPCNNYESLMIIRKLFV